MKNNNKLMSCILICAILLNVLTVQCFATIQSPDAPLFDNVSNTVIDISFYGNKGNATGTFVKQSGTTYSEGTVTIYKLVEGTWIYVDSAYKRTSRTLAVSVDFIAENGVQYKAVFDVTAYRGDVGESHSVTKYKTCP